MHKLRFPQRPTFPKTPTSTTHRTASSPQAHAHSASTAAVGLSASLQREAAAHHAALAAAQQEAAALEALTAARREAAAAARALVAQLRRVQALEALRLKDLQVGVGLLRCRPAGGK